MPIRKKLQSIFFDFDGVIVDSTLIKEDAFRIIFTDYPEVIENLLNYHRQHGGISRVEKIAWVHRELLKKPLSDTELNVWAERYSALVLDKVVSAPYIAGAKEILEKYQQNYADIPLFVVSGTPEPELREIVKHRGLENYFTAVFGSPRRKPVIVREQLQYYNFTPDQSLFIGDAMTDYNTAVETGLEFIGIKGALPFPPSVSTLEDCRGLAEEIEKRFIL